MAVPCLLDAAALARLLATRVDGGPRPEGAEGMAPTELAARVIEPVPDERIAKEAVIATPAGLSHAVGNCLQCASNQVPEHR